MSGRIYSFFFCAIRNNGNIIEVNCLNNYCQMCDFMSTIDDLHNKLQQMMKNDKNNLHNNKNILEII